jgi:hypothetical protein
LGFRSDDDEGDWESDGEGELTSIVPVRFDLLSGGARALYLGWILRVQAGEIAESTVEPEVPTGLARLSAGETALVEFLRIDPDLVAAAAQRPAGRAPQARRTVGQLLSAAKARRREADQQAADEARREREQREAVDAAIRAKHLHRIAAREADAWREVESLVNSRRPTAYDQAVVLLQDLREISDGKRRASKFSAFLEGVRQRHGAKGTFLTRLDRARL